MKVYKFLGTITIITLLVLASCKKENMSNYNNLSNLPTDTGGVHKAFPMGINEANYGYYVYTPSVKGPSYPLLVFLHGAGEKGNSSEDNNILDLVLKNGPPKLIVQNKWKPTYPMIVVSPQCHESNWNGSKIHEFIQFIIENYDVNTKRIYE